VQEASAQTTPVDRPEPHRPRRRLTIALIVGSALLVVGFLGVTALTGLAGPGMLRRYPYRDLSALAESIDDLAADIRTPDDCWRELHGNDGPIRQVVRVDHLRSRVVVRAHARTSGRIDPSTFRAVTDRIDEAIASNPRYSWQMVQIEPSPDGWSPLVSCRLVTRGWTIGF
jgi:hypothetical protein